SIETIRALSSGDAFTIYGTSSADVLDFRGSVAVGTMTVQGGLGDDKVYGSASADVISGEDGADTLMGGGGADALDGGAGVDTADFSDKTASVVATLNGGIYATVTVGGAAEDTIRNIENLVGGSAEDTLTGDALANTLSGGGAADLLRGGGGADTLDGGAAEDTIRNIENVIGGSTADTLTGDGLDNVFRGGAGADILDGGAGADTADYSDKTAAVVVTLTGATNAIVKVGGAAEDAIRNIENVIGGSAADTLTGDGSNNVFWGGDGADILDGAGGADVMAGGAGNDTYYVDNAGDLVKEASGAGTDSVYASVSFSLAGQNIENLTLTGSAAINGTGNGLANILTGNAGNNVLNGGGGADVIAGGAGNDTYYVDNAGDVVKEASGAGTDWVYASVSFSLAGQNIETLALTGSAAINGTGNGLANSLTGNAANNVLNGGGGADVMAGGAGNDTYYVDNAGDVVNEASGAGTDLVYASVSYSLAGQNLETLTLTGSAAINATGNSLANTLTGNAGNNVLNGGAGNDTLNGGAGADRFVFNTALNGATNVDTIVGFSVVDDKITLENGVFTALTTLGTLSPDAFYVGAAAHDATDRIIYTSGTGALSYDADGSGAVAAVRFATLSTGLTTLANTNFVVI
ncbi:Ca2+-binding RTX toxin-like protein, partial [Rhodoblastus acidophilus]|uniref:beta strand repeat-containing protein n=1 Tax=Rhodoblastus acidophilus TaxID=1074 RepID=UPI0022246097